MSRPREPLIPHSEIPESADPSEDAGAQFWAQAPEMLAVVGFDGVLQSANPEIERLLAAPGASVVGRPGLDFVHPDDHEAMRAAARHLIDATGATEARARLRLVDGTYRPFSGSVAAHADERAFYIIGIPVSATSADHHAAAGAYRDAFDAASVGMALVAFGGANEHLVVHANSALARITGHTVEEMQGRPLGLFLHHKDVQDSTWLNDVLQAGGRERYTVEHRIEHADGHLVWALMSVSLIRDGEGAPAFQVVQIQDVSDRKRYEGRLEFLAEHDPLTGLFNRRRFGAEVERQVAYVRRHKGRGCVLFLDLDNFKYINDTLGHAAGDDLIIATAGVLREHSRVTDVVSRLGGDEFALLLPETSADEAMVHAERIRQAVSNAGYRVGDEAVRMSVSIGIAEFGGDTNVAPEDLMMDADLAMYEAKDAGRDGVRIFGPASLRREHVAARMAWSVRIREALEEGLFVLHAQPILDISRDEVTHYELLIRMVDEGGALILPAQFLYTAERFGMALDIDRWVLGEAIKILAGLPQGSPIKIAVNISGGSLDGTDLTDWLTELLRDHEVHPSSLVIEVTETEAITNMERARRFADALQQLDCEFALDDFGAGFGSFYYLKHLPIDYLKIDGDYVRTITTSRTDQVIVEAVVQLASGLGKRTVAEFVGDQPTLELLTALGVDYAQGFHIGAPKPWRDIDALRPAAGA